MLMVARAMLEDVEGVEVNIDVTVSVSVPISTEESHSEMGVGRLVHWLLEMTSVSMVEMIAGLLSISCSIDVGSAGINSDKIEGVSSSGYRFPP